MFNITGGRATVVSPVVDNGRIVDDSGIVVNIYTSASIHIIPVYIRTGNVLTRHE